LIARQDHYLRKAPSQSLALLRAPDLLARVAAARGAKTRAQRKSLMARIVWRSEISNLRSAFSSRLTVVVPEEPTETSFTVDFVRIGWPCCGWERNDSDRAVVQTLVGPNEIVEGFGLKGGSPAVAWSVTLGT